MLRMTSALVLAAMLTLPARAADWPVFGQNPERSGVLPSAAITVSNAGRLHEAWRVHLGDVADEAPVVVGNRLFVTSKGGTTYAIDTANGRVVWHFATQGPKITTAVPAYDAATKSLYVAGVDGYVHKLDPATGTEQRAGGFPKQITFAPETEKDASSLNVANGYLYAQTSGYIGDAPPYVGHIVAIHLSDGSKRVFNTLCADRHELIRPATCAQQRAGMWSRAGVVVDPDPSMAGRVYGVTGNAPFDPSKGAYGDSIVAVSQDGSKLLAYATPKNYDQLETEDQDLGSSSPAMLPRQPQSATPLMMVQGGKDETLRLYDRTHLGGLGDGLQQVKLDGPLFGAPAIWTDPHGKVWIFVDVSGGAYAYTLQTANRKSRVVSAWHADVPSTREGTSPVVAGGVVFVAGDSVLVALDATSGKRLWSHDIGPIHWQSPSLAGAAVYCADDDGYLWKFSL